MKKTKTFEINLFENCTKSMKKSNHLVKRLMVNGFGNLPGNFTNVWMTSTWLGKWFKCLGYRLLTLKKSYMLKGSCEMVRSSVLFNT